MPWGLKRYHETGQLHFITFSCYHRHAKLGSAQRRTLFEHSLERTRKQYRLLVLGYVVMPEHVHMMVTEPEAKPLSRAMQSLKQSVSRRLGLRAPEPFWQARYYDFNVWSERKLIEKLRYMHRNPVKRQPVRRSEDWQWSSFVHYATASWGVLDIESDWTAQWREKMGNPATIKIRALG